MSTIDYGTAEVAEEYQPLTFEQISRIRDEPKRVGDFVFGTITATLDRERQRSWDVQCETRDQVTEALARAERAEHHVDQLLADVNGTDWMNALLENAPEEFDGDEAQCEIVTRYVRWLEGVAAAARQLSFDVIRNGSYCPSCGLDWNNSADPHAADCNWRGFVASLESEEQS